MWTSPPTAQGKRGLDRLLLNLSQLRPGTKLSVAAAPADGRVTTSSPTPPQPREDWEHGVDLYVARQPILDRSRWTYAYELLSRDGLINAFNAEDPDLATAVGRYPEAVDRLPVSEDVRTALLGGDNALRRVYEVVLAW